MPRKPPVHNPLVLQLKLEEVTRYIQAYEEKIRTFKGVIGTNLMLQETASAFDAPELAENIKRLLLPLIEMGVPVSYIEGDLQQIRRELGPDHAAQIIAHLQTIGQLAGGNPAQWCRPNDATATRQIGHLAASISVWLDMVLQPALILRDRLTRQINELTEPGSAATPKKRANALRDQIIRQEARRLGYQNPMQVFEAVKDHPKLKSLCDDPEIKLKLTYNIVREALKHGKKRG